MSTAEYELEATNLKTTHPMAKLAQKRLGPLKIRNKISKYHHKLSNYPHGGKSITSSTPHSSPRTPKRTYTDQTTYNHRDIVEWEPEFEVERVLQIKMRREKQNLSYIMHWKGYSQAHDSWEPAKQVHAPELVEQYLIMQKGDREIFPSAIRGH